jgi:putative membrane protein
MWIFPMVMPIVMIVVLALCLYFLFGRRGPAAAGPFQGREESALDILKKRYAKGEISREEFEQMKKDLLN